MEEDPFAETSSESTLLSCSFNQDGGCLAIGTTTGFSIHNLHPQYAVSVQRQLQYVNNVLPRFICCIQVYALVLSLSIVILTGVELGRSNCSFAAT
jgi:hypothetical protein